MNDTSAGLVYAHVIAPDGGREVSDWETVKTWQPVQGILWVHLDAENPTALAWLKHDSGLRPLVVDALLELGTRPRSTIVDAGLLAIFRGVNCNPGADPEDMVAIRM